MRRRPLAETCRGRAEAITFVRSGSTSRHVRDEAAFP
jgi:hypothetical protein